MFILLLLIGMFVAFVAQNGGNSTALQFGRFSCDQCGQPERYLLLSDTTFEIVHFCVQMVFAALVMIRAEILWFFSHVGVTVGKTKGARVMPIEMVTNYTYHYVLSMFFQVVASVKSNLISNGP